MRARIALLALALLLSAAAPAAAQFDCLLDAQGDTLLWKKTWQADGRDDDVEYRIISVQRDEIDGRPAVTLELYAWVGAQRPYRYISVTDRKTVQLLCGRLNPQLASKKQAIPRISKRAKQALLGARIAAEEQRKPELPKVISHVELPFIMYGPKGWMRSDPPQNTSLSQCQVFKRTFSCLPQDKRLYGERLRTVEAQWRALQAAQAQAD